MSFRLYSRFHHFNNFQRHILPLVFNLKGIRKSLFAILIAFIIFSLCQNCRDVRDSSTFAGICLMESIEMESSFAAQWLTRFIIDFHRPIILRMNWLLQFSSSTLYRDSLLKNVAYFSSTQVGLDEWPKFICKSAETLLQHYIMRKVRTACPTRVKVRWSCLAGMRIVGWFRLLTYNPIQSVLYLANILAGDMTFLARRER